MRRITKPTTTTNKQQEENQLIVIHHHLSSIMTYQQPNPNYDNAIADEASSLLTVVTASPASSSTKKKNGVPMMRAVIATWFLLGTLAVIYYGGPGCADNTGAGDSSVCLDHGASVYDPSHGYCFADTDNAGKNCWCPTDNYPVGRWKGVSGVAYGQCGEKCTEVHPTGYTDGV